MAQAGEQKSCELLAFRYETLIHLDPNGANP
jgi:hypothetical protein